MTTPVVKVVCPKGTGDYLNLQAWWDWAKTQSMKAQWAEVRSGGSVGDLNMTIGSYDGDATDYPKVYAAPGHRFTGTSLDTTKAFGEGTVFLGSSYARLEGMQFTASGRSAHTLNMQSASGGQKVDGCLFQAIMPAGNPTYAAVNVFGYYSGAQCSLRNCIVIARGNAIAALYYENPGGASGYGCLTDMQNNTCITKTANSVTPTYGVYIVTGGNVEYGGGLGAYQFKNNVVMGDTASGSISLSFSGEATSSNNCSDDATADDFSGSGHIVNQTPTSIFNDYSGGDYTLKIGSNAIDAGADLSGTFTNDVFGNTRTLWNMGATENRIYIDSVIKASGGDYTNLADWFAAKDGLSAGHYRARCHNDVNLGPCHITSATSGSTFTIEPAVGHGHGLDFTAGAYTTGQIKVADADVTINGIRFTTGGTDPGILVGTGSENLVIKNCLLEGCGITSETSSNERWKNGKVFNNIIRITASGGIGIAVDVGTGGSSPNPWCVIENNTVDCTSQSSTVGISVDET